MFDAQQLLGSLLNQNTHLRQLTRLPTSIAGVAAVGGLALAAYQHHQKKQQNQPNQPAIAQPASSVPPPPPPVSAPAPAPVLTSAMANAEQPITLSKKGDAIYLGQVFAPTPTPSQRQENALLLIRAMIAAANADGVIDQQERQKILTKLTNAGLNQAEQQFIQQELNNPTPLPMLLSQIDNLELAQQFYTVSLLAIELDTEIEKNYLRKLAEQLSLDADYIQQLHQQFATS